MPPVEINIDVLGMAQAVVNGLIEGIRDIVNPLPMELLQWIFNGIQQILTAQGANNVLTRIPLEWTSSHGEIVALWKETLKAQLGLMALVLVIQGYRVQQHQADLLPTVFRTGFQYILGITLIWSSGMVFTIVNAFCESIGGTPLWITEQSVPNDFVLGIALIIGGFFALLAWLKGAVGIVFLDVLIVAGPFIATLSALPWFSGLGKWWLEEFTTWCLRPIMVALVLRLGLGLGVIAGNTPLMMLFAIVAFWLAWTMDQRLRRFSVGAWGSIGQLNLLNRGASAAAAAFGGPGIVAGAAAAGAAATASSNP